MRGTLARKRSERHVSYVITLSSNASRVPFEYPQYYLNKEGKACKARVKEWINLSSIIASKRYRRGFQCGCWETFPKSATTFLTSPTIIVNIVSDLVLLYNYSDLFTS